MAQDAELKLKVSLDLAFFRQQLAGLGQAAAGYSIPIRFDRSSIQKELNALGANIRRRNYRLTIETNLSAEIVKAETLARKLAGLGGKLKTGSGGFAASPQGAAGLMEYMQSQGLSGGGGFVGVGRSARFKNALEELTVKQLQGLAKSESITGVSRLKKSALVDKLMNDLSQQAMENILGNAQMSLRRFEAQYKSPIGPLPMGSKEPWARGSRGMYGGAGYEPFMAPRQQAPSGFAKTPGAAGIFAATGIALQGTIPGMAYQMAKPTMGSMGQFPMAGMMGPSSPLGINARSSMFAGGGGLPPGGGGGFRNAMGLGPSAQPINLDVFNRARVPLSGAIRELSSEFANATKQVLLFGTAYKGLAFFMDLPNQAFQAAKGLATYKNQLQAVTAESGTFEQSFAFVDNLATRFNVPLESARQGFVKLYASMQPAGFDQGQIEGLFTGISKAAAAFGLSSDKVDRVNYAFAQMASKGQIMSEELKGQLGDVLPGALGLFAQAAQMSIPEFSKAMEDGAFKGEAMAQVLGNVAILMNDKFGPAAQGAAKTLQGALNQMQNNLQLMYESMTPIVNQFASAFGGQINSLIKDVTNAIKLLTGNVLGASEAVGTLSPRSQAMYTVFQQLGPSIASAASNMGRFLSSLQILIGPLVAITKGLLDLLSVPFVARIGLYATIVTALTGTFRLLATAGVLQATIALVRFAATLNIAQINIYIAGLQTIIAVLRSLITTANIARLTLLGLKVALVSFGVGVVLLGLDAVAQRLLNIGDAANSAKKNTRELAQELDRIAGSGDIEAATKQYLDANTKLAMAQKKNRDALAELRRLERAAGPRAEGAEPFVVKEARMASETAYSEVLQARRDVQAARQARNMAVRTKEQQDQRTQAQLKPISAAGGEGKGDGTKLRDYQSQDIQIQQKNLDNLKKEIEAKVELTRREKDLQIARVEYSQGEKIIDLQYAERIKDIDKLKAGTRALALEEASRMKGVEKNILKQEYNKAVLGDLFNITENYSSQIASAEDKIAGLSKTTGELTEREKLDLAITRQLQGVRKEDLALFQDRIDLARALADRLDMLNESEKQILETRKLQQDISNKEREVSVMGAGLQAGFYGSAAQAYEQMLLQPGATPEDATRMAELETQAMQLQAVFGGIQNAIGGVSSAFSNLMTEGIASMVQGTATAQEVFSQFLNSIGQALQQAAAQMIATYVAIGIARIFAGMGASPMGLEGATKAAGNLNPTVGFGAGTFTGFAKGGVALGGFKAFADGGVVNGPTLGLVGEGKYNEAIVPLPDGRAIPVQMQGDSVRDKMNGSGNGGAAVAPMLSMNFETTTINNVEYVSREQLEKAMMETRKLATRDGARQGANLAIDKIQQSPNTRRRIGI